MSVLVGKKAPLFSSKAIIDGEKIVENFSLEQFIGKKTVVLFLYPKYFTFVCPTELFAFQEKLKDFKDRNVELIACSTDSEESHWGWLQVDKDNGGIKGITYPIIADIDIKIAELIKASEKNIISLKAESKKEVSNLSKKLAPEIVKLLIS